MFSHDSFGFLFLDASGCIRDLIDARRSAGFNEPIRDWHFRNLAPPAPASSLFPVDQRPCVELGFSLRPSRI